MDDGEMSSLFVKKVDLRLLDESYPADAAAMAVEENGAGEGRIANHFAEIIERGGREDSLTGQSRGVADGGSDCVFPDRRAVIVAHFDIDGGGGSVLGIVVLKGVVWMPTFCGIAF